MLEIGCWQLDGNKYKEKSIHKTLNHVYEGVYSTFGKNKAFLVKNNGLEAKLSQGLQQKALATKILNHSKHFFEESGISPAEFNSYQHRNRRSVATQQDKKLLSSVFLDLLKFFDIQTVIFIFDEANDASKLNWWKVGFIYPKLYFAFAF